MSQIKLTKNFTMREMACKGKGCCGNSCPMDSRFMEALQALRDAVGVSILVTSGFRCNTYNAKLAGSVPNSSHTRGLAADIKVKGMTPIEVYNIAKKLPEFENGSFGIYNTFIHVSTDGRGALWGPGKDLVK